MAEILAVNPDQEFIAEVFANGGEDFKKCFQCATCTSVCPISTPQVQFPRRQVLLAQWGLKEELLRDPGPWLCFYCGDCSKICPRQANPGETMMSLRRYLTSQYDWTGLSRLMYRSGAWEIGILALVSALVASLFILPHDFGFRLLARSGPAALGTVMLSQFAPKEIVHIADRILATLLGLFLLSNGTRMFRQLTRDRKIPASLYFTCLPELVVQGLTQKRWAKCGGSDAIANWLRHLLLVSGYATIFILVVMFLPWFQIEDTSFHWSSFLGYYSVLTLLVATAWMVVDRVRQRTEMHRFSHLSDWLFPILLFLTALTGIMVNILRLVNLPMPTYVMYTVHLAIAVPMLVVEVPFGKWGHLLYRPLAIYVAEVRRVAAEVAAPGAAAAREAALQG
jgi:ferredoxin